ncbi:pilus assembly protein TadG-related protein [Pseudomonas sp. FME51]|uniref:pilus assembly protein TadG-related protein n=1 Tax=Pseudomonas sp. FME51 TaxID=2742609 RepID=UPI001868B8A7|nr:pilus assembly protein TadG-related protein [Pseudomonas sp. FME51]
MTFPHLLLNRQRQHGAFSIMAAFTLLMLLMFLVLVLDSGRLYMEQRKLQKVADTAALGALLLLPDGNCSTDRGLTKTNANDNADANGFTGGLTLQCVDIEQLDGLRVATPNETSGRAVEVTVAHDVPSSLILQVGSVFNSSLTDKITLRATAVAARDEPVAVFSVESQLLTLDESGLLAKLLSGVGLNTETLKLLTSDGLAAVKITPSGLLKALGVKSNIDLKALTPEGLIKELGVGANLFTLPQLLDASIKLIAEDAANVGIDLLDAAAIPVGLEDLQLQLFSTYDQYGNKIPGIISVDTNAPLGAALDTRINLGEILRTAILIGAQGRGISIGAPSDIGVPAESLDLLGLVKLEAGIVEPPSIGIGPVGTTAHNAQIRLLIDADTSDTLLIGGLLDALDTRVHLPVIIEITNATAKLTKLTCDGSNPEAEIETTGSIADICIGDMPAGTMWSTSESCLGKVEDVTLASALGISLVKGSIGLPVLKNPTDDRLSFTLTNLPSTQLGQPNELPTGTLVKEIIDELLNLTLTSQDIPDAITTEMAEDIANSYISNTPPTNGEEYTNSQLDTIKGKLEEDGFNWDNPALPLCLPIVGCIELGKKAMPDNWRDRVVGASCGSGSHTKNCVKSSLIESLQSKSSTASLDVCLFGFCLSKVTNPLLQGVLSLVIDPLKRLLDFVGEYVLTPILSDLLGLKIGQSKVTVHDANCGAPRLVR